jgi:hypothetical protein
MYSDRCLGLCFFGLFVQAAFGVGQMWMEVMSVAVVALARWMARADLAGLRQDWPAERRFAHQRMLRR